MPGDKLTPDEIGRIYREIVGEDHASPAVDRRARDEQAERVMIAKTIALLDRRCDPMTLITMLAIGLKFLSEEHHVGIEQVITVLREARQVHNLEMTAPGPGPVLPE